MEGEHKEGGWVGGFKREGVGCVGEDSRESFADTAMRKKWKDLMETEKSFPPRKDNNLSGSLSR